jgi:hypothetical protein
LTTYYNTVDEYSSEEFSTSQRFYARHKEQERKRKKAYRQANRKKFNLTKDEILKLYMYVNGEL